MSKTTVATSAKDDRGWNIYQRRDGQRVLQFRVAAGDWSEHRIPRELRTARAAERYALTWLDEYRKNLCERPALPVERPDDKGPTVKEIAPEWVKLLDARVRNKKLKPSTRRGHESNLDAHVLPMLGGLRVADLDSLRLRKWVRDELPKRTCSVSGRKKNAKPSEKTSEAKADAAKPRPLAVYTMRNVVFTMTALLDDAVAERWGLAHNAMREKCVRDEVPSAETRAGDGVVIHISRDQASKLLACPGVPEFWRVIDLLAVTSGMREDEIGALTWAEVKLDAEVAHAEVNHSVDRDGGKVILTAPKTKHARRAVPLHHLALRALKAWKVGGWTQLVGRPAGPSDPVFPDDKGSHRVLSNAAAQLRTDLRRAKCPDTYAGHNIVFHSLRASFLTWLADAGVEKALRDRLVGHRPADVGEKHYTARTLGTLREAVESIKLDLRTGEVVSLPLRAVASGETIATPLPETVADTAVLTAARGTPAASTDGFLNDSTRRGWDSNPRMTVLQATAAERAATRTGASPGEFRSPTGEVGARGGNDGAASGTRGKLAATAAVSVREAIEAIDRGDVTGARSLLVSLLG